MHPNFPKNCVHCPFYKSKGIKNQIRAVFQNRKKDCFHCPYIDAKLLGKEWSPSQHSTTRDKYIKGQVLVSPYYSENELTDNKRLANFLADKLKTKIYLLPRLEQTTEEGRRLRCKLLPRDVKEGKNPDYLINGLLFDGKSMYGLKKRCQHKGTA